MTREHAPADMLAAQARTKLFALLSLLGILATAAWFFAGRTVLEPDRVLVAIAVGDEEDSAAYWWGGDAGSAALHGEVVSRLESMGLRGLLEGPEQLPAMLDHFAGATVADFDERAAALGIGTVIRGRVELQEVLPLEGARVNDMVLLLHLEVLDLTTGEVHEVPGHPMRLFLWGVDATAAVERNARYVAERVAMPLAETLAALPELARYGDLGADATNLEQLMAKRLDALQLRANNYRAGLELRAKDIAEAEANEAPEHSGVARTRLGGALDAEFFVGERSDGRPLVLRDMAHVAVPSNRIGYALPSSSERLELVPPQGERQALFEHYNFFSTAAVSGDGSQVACVLANRGASKTLGLIDAHDGLLTPLLTHESEYFSAPLPSPDASQVVFFSRPSKEAPLALEVITVADQERRVLVDAGPSLTMPVWSPDGATLYLGLGETGVGSIWAIDVATGEREQLLGLAEGADSAALLEEGAQLDAAAELLDATDEAAQAAHQAALADLAKRSSAFQHLSLAADGATLFVSETSPRGDFVGALELESGAYRRVAPLRVSRIMASPRDPQRMALQLYAPGLPDAEQGDLDDSEVVLLELGQDPVPVTQNDIDEALVGWSRDGRALYLQHAVPEPRAARRASRVYRYEVGGARAPAPTPPIDADPASL